MAALSIADKRIYLQEVFKKLVLPRHGIGHDIILQDVATFAVITFLKEDHVMIEMHANERCIEQAGLVAGTMNFLPVEGMNQRLQVV
jgi:hypothetical protein